MSICQRKGGLSRELHKASWWEPQKSSLADLIEHVLETEGDAYLKTPDDELPFLVRNSIDTHASVGTFAALTVALLWKLSRVFARYAMGGSGKHCIDLIPLLICGKKKKRRDCF